MARFTICSQSIDEDEALQHHDMARDNPSTDGSDFQGMERTMQKPAKPNCKIWFAVAEDSEDM